MDKYQETIISSAPNNEIKSFLESLSNAAAENKYFCDHCEIIINRTWVEKMGSLYFQRTEITFFGREELVNHYTKLFRLRFLSAGG